MVNFLLPRTPGGPPSSWLTWIQLGICITLQTLVRNDFTHASGLSRTVKRTFAFGCIFIKSSKMQIIGKSSVDLNWPASIVWMTLKFHTSSMSQGFGWRMLETIYVGDQFMILATDFACTNILKIFTIMKSSTNFYPKQTSRSGALLPSKYWFHS